MWDPSSLHDATAYLLSHVEVVVVSHNRPTVVSRMSQACTREINPSTCMHWPLPVPPAMVCHATQCTLLVKKITDHYLGIVSLSTPKPRWVNSNHPVKEQPQVTYQISLLEAFYHSLRMSTLARLMYSTLPRSRPCSSDCICKILSLVEEAKETKQSLRLD